MACISPPALDEGQLLAYIDGEAGTAVASHVEACPDCRERAQALAQLQNALQARLYRLTCPAPETLGDYQLSLLAVEQAIQIAQHLQECPHCTREIAQLREYLREPELPFSSSAWEPLKVLVARMSGDRGEAGGRPLANALRGVDEGPMTFEAEGVLIVLDLQPASRGGWKIHGQVAAEEQDRWTGAQVELRQADKTLMATGIDELGAFQFDQVPAGPAELYLLPEDGPVVIANLEFPA
jgi:hypothetical protein